MGVRSGTHCRLFCAPSEKEERVPMHLTLWHVVGLLATIALIIGIGI